MKLGIFLLIFGSLVAAVGVFAWQYVEPSMWEATLGELFGFHGEYEEALIIRAGGMGLTVFGSGLAVGGIVRMIVKR